MISTAYAAHRVARTHVVVPPRSNSFSSPRSSGPSYPWGYYPPDPGHGADLYLDKPTAPRGLLGNVTSKGAYERDLVKNNPLFLTDILAAMCVLLAPHHISLKEFTALRKKTENRGGLHPVWGYPWVIPEQCSSQNNANALFWKGVRLHDYIPEALRELQEDRLLSHILDLRDLRITFAHLVGRRQLTQDTRKLKVASSARDERGYGHPSSGAIPRSAAKKPQTTYEAVDASVARSRQPLGSQLGAAQSAPTSSRSWDNHSTSRGAGTSHGGAALRVHTPLGSGSLHFGRGEQDAPSYDYEPETPRSTSEPSVPPAAAPEDAEVGCLHQRILVLEIALGIGFGGSAAAEAGNCGQLTELHDRLVQLERQVHGRGGQIQGLHGRVSRRASETDMNAAFDQIRKIWGILRPQAPRAEAPAYVYARPQAEAPTRSRITMARTRLSSPGLIRTEPLKRMTSLESGGPAWDLVFWLWALDGAGDPVSLRGASAEQTDPESRGTASGDPRKTSCWSSST
ncbi:hypothetical protein PC121_g13417 [Phytophthora cactorum]|nr:hypothetical protein PC120_g12097 [Phytophthora cactorum]KAG3060554.1 hypothetical protein PC121_g13417 [Phytophthora cactorum]